MEKAQVHAGGGNDEDTEEPAVQSSGQTFIKNQGTDDLLDEIDGLLEDNAEEFVNAYVQKGGE